MLPLVRVCVIGPSMEPVLRNGDWLLARRTGRVRPGDVVVMTHPRRPDLLIVKRVMRQEADGWWVLGDHPEASEDSRQFGVVPQSCMIGRVICRYKPIRRT